MKHGLLVSAAATIAVCAAAAPAVAGIVGNTSFSYEIRVPVPAGAQVPQVNTGSDTAQPRRPASSSPVPSAQAARHSPGHESAQDDSTQHGPTQHGRTSRPTPEPGDDGGRSAATHTSGRTSGGSRGGTRTGSGSSTDSSGRGGRHGGDG